ncbi:MAG: DeoR/GlpR family DNA-binding transcription regulator [Candidatus Limivicinus sp.]
MRQSQNVIVERRHHIMRLLAQNGSLRVSELCKMLSVSELTIRRDLDELARDGLLYRTHGGAALPADTYPNLPLYEDKHQIRHFQKQEIAKYVSSLTHDGDTIFLNAGTTTMEIIKLVKEKDVVIVTNNALACTVMHNCRASLISTGGEYNQRNQSYTGIMATALMQKINATLCVLGVNGITAEDGITSSNYMETMINEEMLKRCRGKRIVAADSSKVGKLFNFSTAPISSIDLLVTDSGIDPEHLKKFKDAGLEVVLADTISINYHPGT